MLSHTAAVQVLPAPPPYGLTSLCVLPKAALMVTLPGPEGLYEALSYLIPGWGQHCSHPLLPPTVPLPGIHDATCAGDPCVPQAAVFLVSSNG